MTVSQTFLYIVIGIWCLTILRSILLMMGKKVYKDASMNEKNALIPIINLFSMLEIVDLSSYLGILLFIPLVNLIVLVMMSYKLGKVYNCDFGFIMGLVFLPVVFYISLFNSTKSYKNRRNDTFAALESVKDDNINLLTEEEIKAQNDSPYDLDPCVDSIFKSKLDTIEEAPAYKASKLDKDIIDNLKDLGEEENPFEPIKRIEHLYNEKEEKEKEEQEKILEENIETEDNKSNDKFVSELSKKDKVEYVDF